MFCGPHLHFSAHKRQSLRIVQTIFFVHIYNFPICFFEMNLRGTSKTKIDGIFALLNDVWKFNTWWKSSKKLCHRGTLVQILMLKGNDFVRFKVYKISFKLTLLVVKSNYGFFFGKWKINFPTWKKFLRKT